jgi:hypothetical protein
LVFNFGFAVFGKDGGSAFRRTRLLREHQNVPHGKRGERGFPSQTAKPLILNALGFFD